MLQKEDRPSSLVLRHSLYMYVRYRLKDIKATVQGLTTAVR